METVTSRRSRTAVRESQRLRAAQKNRGQRYTGVLADGAAFERGSITQAFLPIRLPSVGGDGSLAGVGGRGRRGTAGGGSTERLWKRGKRGNEEGHVTHCKLKCGRGGEKRSREAEIWKPRHRRTGLKSTGNACMQFSAFFPRKVLFLPLEETHPCTSDRACCAEGL